MKLTTFKSIKQNFLSELARASRGEESSLSFLVHRIPNSPLVKDGEEFQVLVIGGSICKSARVKLENGKITILKKQTKNQPTFHTKQDFLDLLNEELDDDISVIGLNFAYPLAPIFEHGRLDGKLIRGTKEHVFNGLVGKKVGEEAEKYIKQKTGIKITVSVANDTICLLLSGLTRYTADDLAAAIVGTGVNSAIFLDHHTLVNLESANFNTFPVSKETERVDKDSVAPGMALFEKATAGAYLYKHFNLKVEEKNLTYRNISTTDELSSLAQQDISNMSQLAQNLLELSAQLISCQIAAIAEYKQHDLIFVSEGSLFWKGYKYRQTVEETCKKLTKFKVTFVEIPDSDILGAAKLVS